MPATTAQSPEVWIKEVISREVSVHIGGVQIPEIKQINSREVSLFVGQEPVPSYRQAVSREVSVVMTTPQAPSRVTPLVVTPSPTGDIVTLSWTGYNELAQQDVVQYDVYLSTRSFTNISQMTRYATVRAETHSITLTNLPVWEDHFFAVVAVDAAGGLDPEVTYSAAYALTREVVSREMSIFVGGESEPPYKEVVSREVSLVVSTPQVPARVTPLTVTPSPLGDTVALSWTGYNEWVERDVARYDIYLSTRPFTNISGMTRYAIVPAETRAITLTNLPVWEDRFFAVVAVDAAGGFDPEVSYSAAYALTREVVSREVAAFVGAEPEPPYKQVVSREVSVGVPTSAVPDPVTGLGSGFTASTSTTTYGAIDLDWSTYNWLAQKDIVRYRIYAGTAYYDSVTGLEPFEYAPAEVTHWEVAGLRSMGIYYMAVVAEDMLGQWNPVVRSASAQASPVLLGEVRNLQAACGTNSLQISWQPPAGAESFLASYRVYFAGASVPVVLPPTTTSHTFTDLLPAHGYPVRVSTVDRFGFESAGASLLAATLMPNPAPLSSRGFNGMVRLKWDHIEPFALVKQYAVYVAFTNFTSITGMTPVLLTRDRQADVTGLINGTTYYFAVTTINLVGGESPEVKTVSAAPDSVVGDYADLVVTNFVVPVSIYPGKSEVLSWQVVNLGPNQTARQDQTAVNAWTDRLLLSANDALGDADDVLVADIRHNGGLGPLAEYATNVTVQIPRIQPGEYHVILVADVLDEVYEFLDQGPNAALAANLLKVRLTVAPGDQWVEEERTLTVTNLPATSGLPDGSLAFELIQAPRKMNIDPVTGVITWSPSEVQGPSTNVVVVRVTDTGVPVLRETNQFTVFVMEPASHQRAPTLELAPQDIEIVEGQNGFLYSVASGTAPLSYYWRKDGQVLAGAAEAVLVVSNVVPAMAGSYTLQVSNQLGSVVSAPATVRIVQPAHLSSLPQDLTVSLGGTLRLTVGATGTEPVSYQWRHNGMPIPNATNAVLVISPVTLADGGNYTAVVSNPWGLIETAPVLVTVTGVGPIYMSDAYELRPVYTSAQQLGWTNNLNATEQTNEPLHAGKIGGTSLWMGWVAPAHGVVTFRTTGSSFDTLLAVYAAGPWAGIGSRLVASDEDRGGFLTSELAFTAEAGQEYGIAVDGFAGASGIVVLSWTFEPVEQSLPVIVAQSTSQVVLEGTPLILEVQAAGDDLTYQWRRNGQSVPGANGAQLSLGQVTASLAGTYTVGVTNGAGLDVLSADIVLEVALSETAIGPPSQDKWQDLFPLQTVRPQSAGGSGYIGLALGEAGARDQSAESFHGQGNEATECEKSGGAARWLWLRPQADGGVVIDTQGSTVVDEDGNPLSVLLGVYEYRSGSGLIPLGCDSQGGDQSTVVVTVTQGQDLVVQLNVAAGAKGTVRVNWNLAAAAQELRLRGIKDGWFHVVEPVPGGLWRLESGDNLQRWTTIRETNVHSGLFQYSERFNSAISNRIMRIIQPGR